MIRFSASNIANPNEAICDNWFSVNNDKSEEGGVKYVIAYYVYISHWHTNWKIATAREMDFRGRNEKIAAAHQLSRAAIQRS